MSQIVSIDIETSSSSLDGVLISIGLVKYAQTGDGQFIKLPGEEFYEQVKFRHGLFIKPEAMLVNKISMEQLDDKSRLTLDEVDKKLVKWLEPKSIMMGRGVSYFDNPFIRRDLPKASHKISRRIFDLTPLFFGASLLTGKSFSKVRGETLRYAAEMTKKKHPELFRHHALYDAWSNCFALDYLLERFNFADEFVKHIEDKKTMD